MTIPIERDPMFRRGGFDAEIVELCVRWYITYRLSYRDLVAMMTQRGLIVSHTTIRRWVVRYAPQFEKRQNRWARQASSAWHMHETYVLVRGEWRHLYRAIDKHGKTIDVLLLRRDCGIALARAFFRKAMGVHSLR